MMRKSTWMLAMWAVATLGGCGTTAAGTTAGEDVAGEDAVAQDAAQVSDTASVDAQTSDVQTSDVQTTDAQTVDIQTSDVQTEDSQTTDILANDAPTFAQVQEQALSGCGGYGPMSCHGSAPFGGNLNLGQANNWKSLVNVDSVAKPGVALVKPGDPENSMLWRKLTNTLPSDDSQGGPMPKGEAIQWQKPPYADLVYAWILAGAKDN